MDCFRANGVLYSGVIEELDDDPVAEIGAGVFLLGNPEG